MTPKQEETYRVAYIWSCGDECGCTRPMVDERSPNRKGPPRRRVKSLWSGTFASTDCGDTQRERAAQLEELREAAWWFGAKIVEQP